MKKLAVVALGGNAVLRENQTGTIEEQEQNVYDTLENLVYLIKDGYNLIITHGNGPQVGNILMQSDAGEEKYNIAPIPLDICIANTQGSIGYMIERMLRNVMFEHHIENKSIITMITQVLIDKNDPAFSNPSKRIGRAYTEDKARELKNTKGWEFKESSKHNNHWQRVVPSPAPQKILNNDTIEKLAREGNIIIATGGGGIPVYHDEKNILRPEENAVIDKDLASSLLASSVRADEFYVLTDVPYVYLDYKKPNQRMVEFLDKKDTEKYINAGMFSEGTMLPKIRACLNFIDHGGKKSVITEATRLEDRSFGTLITLNY